MNGIAAAWATEKVDVVADVCEAAPRKTLREEFETLGLGACDRDAFYAGACAAFEMYEEARSTTVFRRSERDAHRSPLAMEVEMIDALRDEIAEYAERAS